MTIAATALSYFKGRESLTILDTVIRAPQAIVLLQNIRQDYQHLHLNVYGACNHTPEAQHVFAQLNYDQAGNTLHGNQEFRSIMGSPGQIEGFGGDHITIAVLGSTTTAGTAGYGDVLIHNYADKTPSGNTTSAIAGERASVAGGVSIGGISMECFWAGNQPIHRIQLYVEPYQFTASAGSATTATANASARTWVANEWAGLLATVIGGTGFGQSFTITSNTGTVLTFPAQGTPLDATSRISIPLMFAANTRFFAELLP